MSIFSNVATRRGEANPSSVRLAPDTIPEAKNSRTGVSIGYVLDGIKSRCHYKGGNQARVFDGPFKGVEGVVGHYRGQQRIGIVVGNLFTIKTSYFPKDFIENETGFD